MESWFSFEVRCLLVEESHAILIKVISYRISASGIDGTIEPPSDGVKERMVLQEELRPISKVYPPPEKKTLEEQMYPKEWVGKFVAEPAKSHYTDTTPKAWGESNNNSKPKGYWKPPRSPKSGQQGLFGSCFMLLNLLRLIMSRSHPPVVCTSSPIKPEDSIRY